MKKLSIITLIAVAGVNITGCATIPLNTNCVTISGEKVDNPNYAPSTGTAVGASTGAATGAIVGGIIGFSAGAATGIATGPIGALVMAPIVYGLAGGITGVGIGALVGVLAGGAGGYAYDYKQAKNGTFQYSVACGNPNGQKFYTVSKHNLYIESGPDITYLDTVQPDYTQIESATPVNLFTNSDGYYIERQIKTKESENK